MRRFLYYNQDSINSLLAQIEQGLLLKQESGGEQANTASSTSEIQSNITGDLSAKVFGVGTSLQGNIKGIDSDTDIVTTMVRNIQEKVAHDYAFDKVHKHMSENGMINKSALKIGDFVSTSEQPTFLDFGYFQGLFAPNGVFKLASDQAKKEMQEQLNAVKQNLPKGAQMPEPIKAQIKMLENKMKNSDPERKELERMLEAIRIILPYKRFLMTDCLLIPLEDANFRDDPEIVAFKYGGKISVFGYVTNIISGELKAIHNNDFAPLYDTLNSVMLGLFKNKQEVYIVHPIALYY